MPDLACALFWHLVTMLKAQNKGFFSLSLVLKNCLERMFQPLYNLPEWLQGKGGPYAGEAWITGLGQEREPVVVTPIPEAGRGPHASHWAAGSPPELPCRTPSPCPWAAAWWPVTCTH